MSEFEGAEESKSGSGDPGSSRAQVSVPMDDKGSDSEGKGGVKADDTEDEDDDMGMKDLDAGHGRKATMKVS